MVLVIKESWIILTFVVGWGPGNETTQEIDIIRYSK